MVGTLSPSLLADRTSNLLIEEINRLRQAYRVIQARRPFETIAIYEAVRWVGKGALTPCHHLRRR